MKIFLSNRFAVDRISGRIFLFFILLIPVLFFNALNAQEITSEIAKKAAASWVRNSAAFNLPKLQKAGQYSVIDPDNYSTGILEIRKAPNTETLAYVIELQPAGFVILSPNKNFKPVIGYSRYSKFDPAPSPENILLDLVVYDLSKRFEYLNEGYIPRESLEKARSYWDELLKTGGKLGKTSKALYATEYGPLLSTTWGQSTGGGNNVFNYYTPNNWVCGCVATAASQILRYYSWPPKGTDSYSYTEDDVGTLSADYSSTTYEWSSMLTSYSGTSTLAQRQVAGLLTSHTGIAVDMDYSASGSGAKFGLQQYRS